MFFFLQTTAKPVWDKRAHRQRDRLMPVYRSSKASARFSRGSNSSTSDKSVKSVQDDLRCIRGAVASRPEPSAIRHRSPARGAAASHVLSSRARPLPHFNGLPVQQYDAFYEPVVPPNQYYASPLHHHVDRSYGETFAQVPFEHELAPPARHHYTKTPVVEVNPFWVQQAPVYREEMRSPRDYVYSEPLQRYSSPPPTSSRTVEPSTLTPNNRFQRFSFSSPIRMATPLTSPISPDLFSTAQIPYTSPHLAPERAMYQYEERPTTSMSTGSWRPPSSANDFQLFSRPEASRVDVLPDSHAKPRQIQYLNELSDGREWEETRSVSTASRDYASQGENEFRFAAAPIYGI